ncbi:MAG TPA: ATP-binding protein [Bacilli bacterium]
MLSKDFQVSVGFSNLDLYIDKNYCPIIIVNEHGLIVRGNEGFFNMSGYSREDIINMPISRVADFPTTLVKGVQDYESYIKTANKLPFITLNQRDGRRLSCEYSIFKMSQPKQTYYLFMFHDTSDRQELNLLQQFTGTFMKDVNLGVILINTDFKLVDISDMACRVLGVEKDQVLNKLIDEVFHLVPREHQLFQRTILDGLVVRNHAISWMNNQERHELLMDSNLLKDHKGAVVGACVIFKDVSNLRSLEEQVQRSDRLAMIGQIAAGTAHEIRNPLTSIKGFLQVLKKTLLNKGMDKEHGFAEIMLTEIDRINELVSEFLLLSKPKNISYDMVDIPTVLREILPIINNVAILHDATIQYHAAIDLPKVVANNELLKQVCLNICKNGIEAMVEGGILTIIEKTDILEKLVSIEIHDTGPGIPSFLIDKIFDPFFTTKENGTGLGLSVCQRIIHDIGGSIRVSSKGFGTTFTISIPYSLS